MKKTIFILLIMVLSMNVIAMQYIGKSKLCVIHTNNTEQCLTENQNASIDGDSTFNLYAPDYTINARTTLDLWTITYYLAGAVIFGYFIIVFIKMFNNA